MSNCLQRKAKTILLKDNLHFKVANFTIQYFENYEGRETKLSRVLDLYRTEFLLEIQIFREKFNLSKVLPDLVFFHLISVIHPLYYR